MLAKTLDERGIVLLSWIWQAGGVVMEARLIHPPVGLNLFVIKNIAPDITLGQIIRGVLPFVGLMFAAVLLICLLLQIATALPDAVMGATVKPARAS